MVYTFLFIKSMVFAKMTQKKAGQTRLHTFYTAGGKFHRKGILFSFSILCIKMSMIISYMVFAAL